MLIWGQFFYARFSLFPVFQHFFKPNEFRLIPEVRFIR